MKKLLTLAVTALALSACGKDNEATADLASKSGSTVTGTASFKEDGDKVTLTLTVSGATPGNHGAHIHEVGDCSAADATSAGAHWNPSSTTHGGPTDASHHLGDLGNIEIGQDGKGTLTMTMADWKIGDGSTGDVVGKAVVIHADTDMYTEQPSGKSGVRQACGVIAKKE